MLRTILYMTRGLFVKKNLIHDPGPGPTGHGPINVKNVLKCLKNDVSDPISSNYTMYLSQIKITTKGTSTIYLYIWEQGLWGS